MGVCESSPPIEVGHKSWEIHHHPPRSPRTSPGVIRGNASCLQSGRELQFVGSCNDIFGPDTAADESELQHACWEAEWPAA